ncbi:DUF2237 family protein [Devosia sp.]|uniref:DUF2237 family protein n=1 Tax=Devosia sp. TaxID=1871048 RepID=UPI003A904BEB
MSAEERNVFGEPIERCSYDPLTGFFRNGHCWAGDQGAARHLVCIEATAEFLAFSKSRGNDLSTPRPEFAFPGLNPGDRWCIVAERWREAFEAGKAPRVYLKSTHEYMLDLVPFAELKRFALDLS